MGFIPQDSREKMIQNLHGKADPGYILSGGRIPDRQQ